MDRDVLELSNALLFVDEVYERYLRNEEVDPSWIPLFADRVAADHAPAGGNGRGGNGHATPQASAPAPAPASGNGQGGNGRDGAAGAGNGKAVVPTGMPPGDGRVTTFYDRAAVGAPPLAITSHARVGSVTMGPTLAAPSIWPVVNAFRARGHLIADLDPLGLLEKARIQELDPATWGFTANDLDRVIEPTGIHGMPSGTLRQILDHLRATYAGSIGIEFMHISSPTKRTWLADRMETRAASEPSRDTRICMLEHVIAAEGFERFCHVKYPGTKRFSLEGSEALIPMLDQALTHAARLGAIEAVIGMAHRGRLTALECILKRAARDIFAEFEDIEPEAMSGGGDVKYHLGYSTDRTDRRGASLHCSLAFNPSHLEAVDPVVLGRVRAKQIRHGDFEHRSVIGILVHGDAAFAGQGLVAECLNLVSLPGYRTGGTLHMIVNNQVGFTASPAETRSTPYCTDVAKMVECPIWHVNGEDLDAVAQVIEIASEYRSQFGSDVIVDMYCYRKYGHNEMDEPSFTQPLMYDRIQKKESVVEIYGRRLIEAGVQTPEQVADMVRERQAHLESELAAGKSATQRPKPAAMAGMWHGFRGGQLGEPPDIETGVARDLLGKIAASMSTVPEGFTPHQKIVKLLEQRAAMGKGEKPLDWGMAEMLAFGTILWQGNNVRLSGQDCSRGTFSHRHAIITDIKNGSEHLTLGRLQPDQGMCRIYDSPLSEGGVLGFDWGYSLDYPDALVIWEAQFGDFANGAQVIIDQFITASEDKWKRLSGIVLLLPHGYEGQGPEHSSARLERFLQSSAEQNIQVVQPTTPAQMFHLLRRQVLRSWKKPLIVMTPKSLLRLPAAASPIDELTTGGFQRVIGDPNVEPAAVDRVLLCSGKIYYELVEERRKRNDTATAVIRIEELYPWWPGVIERALAPFTALSSARWVQDEPENMGPAFFVGPRLGALFGPRGVGFATITRAESASPATGSHKAHVMEQEQILTAAFTR
jgi:2-oxoglutarate dehydrogenase E1 component